jgi:uncharacterized protein with von Willebrand factor type A (vWA) domain
MTIQTISSAHRDKSGDFVLNSLHFARQLKEKGLPVTLGRTLDALRGLRLIRIEDKEAAYSLFSTHYVSRPEELAVFDAVFEAFWCAKGHPEASEAKRPVQSECNLPLTLPEEMAPSADHAENERPKIS